MGSCSLLQSIFLSQGSNPGLPHCKQILYHLSPQESPAILEWVANPFSRGSSQPRDQTGISSIVGGWIPYQLSYQGNPSLLSRFCYWGLVLSSLAHCRYSSHKLYVDLEPLKCNQSDLRGSLKCKIHIDLKKKKECEISQLLILITCWNPPSQASTVREPRTSRYINWIYKRQRNQISHCQQSLAHRKSQRIPEKHLLLLHYTMLELLTLCAQQTVENP